MVPVCFSLHACVCNRFYDFESDLSDGWEDESIHNNPKDVREKALKMGSNIIQYAFTN